MSFIEPIAPRTDKQKADNSGYLLLATLKQECVTQFEIAWKKRVGGKIENKSAPEAQSFFDSYANKAVLAFDLHAKLQELIYLTDNTWVPLVPPYEYVKNTDGTVTIGNLIEV